MANDLNQCQFIGRLGKAPESKATQGGTSISDFSIAVNKSWKDKSSGQKQEKVEWISIVIFGNLADIANQYLKKGSKIYVSGEFRTRKWQDNAGADHYKTEIIANDLQMLDSREGGHQSQSAQQQAPQSAPAAPSSADGFDNAFDNDVPF